MGGPSANVGSSAKFGVPVFQASMLNLLWGPLAKVALFAKFGVVVFKASILNYPGGPLAKVWCSSIQGICSQLPGGVHQPK